LYQEDRRPIWGDLRPDYNRDMPVRPRIIFDTTRITKDCPSPMFVTLHHFRSDLEGFRMAMGGNFDSSTP